MHLYGTTYKYIFALGNRRVPVDLDDDDEEEDGVEGRHQEPEHQERVPGRQVQRSCTTKLMLITKRNVSHSNFSRQFEPTVQCRILSKCRFEYGFKFAKMFDFKNRSFCSLQWRIMALNHWPQRRTGNHEAYLKGLSHAIFWPVFLACMYASSPGWEWLVVFKF